MTTTPENPLDRPVDAANIRVAQSAYETVHRRRDAARVKADEASLTVDRGRQALQAAHATLDGLESTRGEAASFRAAAVRDGGNALADLPAPLRVRRQDTRDAKDMIDDLEAAQRQLVTDEEKAADRVEGAQRDMNVAARILFGHEVAERLDDYEAGLARLEPVRRWLAAVNGTLTSHHSPNRSDSLPWSVMDRVARATRRMPVPNTLQGEKRFEPADEQAVHERLRGLMNGTADVE